MNNPSNPDFDKSKGDTTRRLPPKPIRPGIHIIVKKREIDTGRIFTWFNNGHIVSSNPDIGEEGINWDIPNNSIDYDDTERFEDLE